MLQDVAAGPGAPDASTVSTGAWGTLITVVLGVVMVGLDGTVVSIANPAIARSLHASLADLQWVTNAYLLALAVALVPGGKLGDRFGRRRMFLAGVVGFTLASAGVAVVGSIAGVIAMRTVQGVFGAFLLPNTIALLRAAFPADQLNRAVGIWSSSSGAAIAGAPVLGGLLVEHVSWQSVFYLNVPIGIATVVCGLLMTPESRESQHERFDAAGLVLFAVSVFCLVYAAVRSEQSGWGDPAVALLLGGALVTGAVFVAVERRARAPMLPLRLLAERSISLGIVTLLLIFAALYGVMFFMSLYFQNVEGLDAVSAGVRLLPLIGVFSLASPLAGRLTGRLGPRVPITAGLALTTASLAGILGLGADASLWRLAPSLAGMGLGVALVIVASTDAIVTTAPVDDAGLAGGLQSVAVQLGGVLGASVLGSVVAVRVQAVLGPSLARRGVPEGVRSHVAAARDLVAQGVVPAEGAHRWHAAVAGASHAAFLSGLHLALLVAGAATLVGTFLGPFVRSGPRGDEPVVAVVG